MKASGRSVGENEAAASETPEDVAAVYRWAKLVAMKYRDFSASRRKARAQSRADVALEQGVMEHALERALSPEARHVCAVTEGAAVAEVLDTGVETEVAAETEVADAGETETGVEVADPEGVGVDSGASDGEAVQTVPAWFHDSPLPTQARPLRTAIESHRGGAAGVETAAGEALLHTRERFAARWSALKEVDEDVGPELPALQPERVGDGRTPLLALFSLAGGVGKTSLAATLGCILSLHGEEVLLIDTTSRGVLPFYFGVRELRPGEVRTCLPREDGGGATISLTVCSAVGMEGDERRQKMLADEIMRHVQGDRRVVLDLDAGSSWLLRCLTELQPIVLVPVTGEMNSALSLRDVERLFKGMAESGERSAMPYYLINQFDASLPLHLDVREVLRRRLGERLLEFAVRRSAAVSEALAAGMTVVEYAPDAAVVQDYNDVASWLRRVTAAVAERDSAQ